MATSAAMKTQVSPETLALLEALAQGIRVGRKRRRWRQEDLAQRAGTSRATIQRLERGDPGIGIGVFLETLVVIDRERVGMIAPVLEEDPAGVQLMTSRLPRRVRQEQTGEF